MKMKGFTLIELVIVIVIIGILSVAALPWIGNLRDEATIAATRYLLNQFRGAIKIQVAEFTARTGEHPGKDSFKFNICLPASASTIDGPPTVLFDHPIPVNTIVGTNSTFCYDQVDAGSPVDDAYLKSVGELGAAWLIEINTQNVFACVLDDPKYDGASNW